MNTVVGRRLFTLAALLAFSRTAGAQSASPFIGRWTGHVQGLGDAEIIVDAVRANGRVDGKMVFPEQNKTFTFGDKLDIVNSINQGVVQGSALTIETAMGGTYRLTLANGQLGGEYLRGTTYKVPVSFRKAS